MIADKCYFCIIPKRLFDQSKFICIRQETEKMAWRGEIRFHAIFWKGDQMENFAGTNGFLNGTDTYGEERQESYALPERSSVEGFLAVEYSPFEEGEYGNGEGDPELEICLPVGPAQNQHTCPEGEMQPEERSGQQYPEEQPEERTGGETGESEKGSGDGGQYEDDCPKEESSIDENAGEDRKRAEHEASEAKRRAEWEARQQAKQEAVRAQLERIRAMNEEELVSESMKRVGADTEKLSRRNMKECVSEYIQTACLEDAAFARQVMLPQKNMVRCFQYISRKAYEYVQDEMKAAGIQPGRDMPAYSSDIPDDLCYHWAEEYFRTMDVKEDKEEEEEFVPKPYAGRTAAAPRGKKNGTKKSPAGKSAERKPTEKKTAEKKASEKKPENGKPEEDGQLSFMGQMSFEDIMASAGKAG